ncbi:hypothetical protein AN641_05100 [Candidatus Epulonipiscioides gigas]|nr:hypothetical protein AN641_05100 [Epulopiscium sp. SCG-C07WGA-EpuloA2]
MKVPFILAGLAPLAGSAAGVGGIATVGGSATAANGLAGDIEEEIEFDTDRPKGDVSSMNKIDEENVTNKMGDDEEEIDINPAN